MALTILTHPLALIMAHQPVQFVLQGTATGVPLRIAGGVTQGEGDSIQADADKKATFELSDYLQGLITEIGKTGNAAEKYTTVPLDLTFTFIEWVGDPPVNNYDLESSSYFLLNAYIPKSRLKVFYSQYPSLQGYLATNLCALSWWPQVTKSILPGQAELLNFIQLFSSSSATMHLHNKLFFTDGTSVDRGSTLSVANVPEYGIVYFPVGYGQLDIATYMSENYPDKELASYSVYAKVGTTVSREYSFVIDPAYYPATRILYIKNPFGFREILTCKGIGQLDVSIKPETAITDGQSLPEKINWKTDREDVVKVNTGFLPAACMSWLTDLLDCTEAYELVAPGVFHPIRFNDVSIPVVHDGEYQFSAELEYEYVYTKKIEVGS